MRRTPLTTRSRITASLQRRRDSEVSSLSRPHGLPVRRKARGRSQSSPRGPVRRKVLGFCLPTTSTLTKDSVSSSHMGEAGGKEG